MDQRNLTMITVGAGLIVTVYAAASIIASAMKSAADAGLYQLEMVNSPAPTTFVGWRLNRRTGDISSCSLERDLDPFDLINPKGGQNAKSAYFVACRAVLLSAQE